MSPLDVGDVVVIQHPDRVGTVCKRILGLPGDVVTKPTTQRGANRLLHHPNTQVLLSSSSSSTSSSSGSSGMIPWLVVPDGHVWVEGDNPWNSSDSRQYGPIPASLIVGRVVCRVWPPKFNFNKLLVQLWNSNSKSNSNSNEQPRRNDNNTGGGAWMRRGDRPIHDDEDDDQTVEEEEEEGDSKTKRRRKLRSPSSYHHPSLAFSGSIIFPAGFHNQIIVRDYDTWVNINNNNTNNNENNSNNKKTTAIQNNGKQL